MVPAPGKAGLLDMTTDDFGGPFGLVLANAVLLHLTAIQLDDVLRKAAEAVGTQGLLAFTVKEQGGDGEAWTTAKTSASTPRWTAATAAEPAPAAPPNTGGLSTSTIAKTPP